MCMDSVSFTSLKFCLYTCISDLQSGRGTAELKMFVLEILKCCLRYVPLLFCFNQES